MRPRDAHAWRLLRQLLWPRWPVLTGLAVVLAISGALPLAGPQLMRAFIDQAAAGARLPRLLNLAGAYAGLGLFAQLAVVGTSYVATRLALAVTDDLRERAAAHALSLDLAYHGATPAGTLVERIDGDATEISKFFTGFVIEVAAAAVTMAGAVALVAREDWRVGLAMAAFAAVALVLTARLRSRAVAQSSAERGAYAGVMGTVTEQLDAAEDLRALGAGAYALDRHELASAAHARANRTAELARVTVWIGTTGCFAVGSTLMLAVGAVLHIRGLVTTGTVFLLFQYVQVLRRPIELIAEQMQDVQRAAAGASRMGDLLRTRPRLPDSGTAHLPPGALAVAFDGVAFQYGDDGQRVLHDVSLTIPPGHCVGLVGHTGSGKTTLARLAVRLWDPTAGIVRLGGLDVRDVDRGDLHRRVAVVTQDVQLFTASVRDNLTLFGAGGAPGDEVLRRLLDRLGLGGWLAGLPAGLDTVLGEATQTSAGQAQLLGLGRAFLRDPGLVLLDEASSRIDPITAALVEHSLDLLLADRTAIVIAHRLRSVQRTDTVVLLEGGRIVETGPRQELAANPDSRFAALLRADEHLQGEAGAPAPAPAVGGERQGEAGAPAVGGERQGEAGAPAPAVGGERQGALT